MRTRWIICLMISIAIHAMVIKYSGMLKQIDSGSPASAVIVADCGSAEIETLPALPEPAVEQPAPPEEKPQATVEMVKFRPNEQPADAHASEFEEPENVETADAEQTKEQPEPEKPAREEKPAQTEYAEAQENTLPAPPELTAEEYSHQIKQYRTALVGQFSDRWQKVPALNTTIPDPAALPEIDRHFGIKVIAYGFVNQKPAPPFIVFDLSGSCFEKADSIDFSAYSNRIKDRMVSCDYQRLLEKAQATYKLDSFMKIIGLVPVETDRYFAAKQFRAIELAGVAIDDVETTYAHYESDHSGGFNLIIDSVLTRRGRKIPILDEEKKYSAVAMAR